MNSKPLIQRMILVASLVGVIYIITSLALYGSGNKESAEPAFLMIRWFRIWPGFIDLRWVTATSECGVSTAEMMAGRSVGCWAYGPIGFGGLGYPPGAIEVARLLGVKGSHTGLLGATWGISLLAVLLTQAWRGVKNTLLKAFSILMLTGSFPVALLLERGNIDLGIFLLLVSIGAFLASGKRMFSHLLAPLFALIAVNVKLYPVVGLLAFCGFSWRQSPVQLRQNTALVLVAMATATGLALTLPWLFSNGGVAANPGEGVVSHSFLSNAFKTALKYWQLLLHANPMVLFTAFTGQLMRLFACGIGFLYCRKAFPLVHAGDHHSFESRFLTLYTQLTAMTWLGCYLLSTSFDYRLVFAIPTLIGMLASVPARPNKGQISSAVLLCGLITLSFFPGLISTGFQGSSLSGAVWRLVGFSHLAADQFALPFLAGGIVSVVARAGGSKAAQAN